MRGHQAISSGFSRVYGAQPALPRGQLVTVECDIVKGLHAFTIVGLPDKAVEEAKDRIAAAIKNTDSDLESPKRSNKKIVFSLAPAELKKEGSAYDLPLALAFLLASEQIHFEPAGKLFAGELALDGSVRSIRGALSIALAAREEGFRELFVPAENADEAALVPDIAVFAIRTLQELLAHLDEHDDFTLAPHAGRPPEKRHSPEGDHVALGDIRGQETAKRGLEIAAAGRHNIALYGPPGTGKTMLARATIALLPPLSDDEMIEVTAIHSLAGTLREPAVYLPPLRSPHHTSSYASLIGGGAIPKPGEVTLAHRGILFLDEFAEFHRDVINALREPLEDAQVSVSRVRGSSVFPANFMLIAALNPCPCGKYGTRDCRCSHLLIEKYRRKISGPVADRIDMWVSVGDMPPEELMMRKRAKDTETAAARARIASARDIQTQRFRNVHDVATNADMGPKELEELAQLSPQGEKVLQQAARSLKLSPRGYHRTIKLARTIADLSGDGEIKEPHMMEALQYRVRDI